MEISMGFHRPGSPDERKHVVGLELHSAEDMELALAIFERGGHTLRPLLSEGEQFEITLRNQFDRRTKYYVKRHGD